MWWLGSCGSRVCWWACGRGVGAGCSFWMAGRTSYSLSHGQWAPAHVLSGEAGGWCGYCVAGRCTVGCAVRVNSGTLCPFCPDGGRAGTPAPGRGSGCGVEVWVLVVVRFGLPLWGLATPLCWCRGRCSWSWGGAAGGVGGARFVHWLVRLVCLSAISWACWVLLMLLCGSGGQGVLRLGLCFVPRFALPLPFVLPGCGASRGPLWCLWGWSVWPVGSWCADGSWCP